jgi:hypothetical protein
LRADPFYAKVGAFGRLISRGKSIYETSMSVRPACRSGLLLMALAIAVSPHRDAAAAEPEQPILHFTHAELEAGVRYGKAECLGFVYSAWIHAGNEDYCARYYLALGAAKPREAIVYFEGDDGTAIPGGKIVLEADWHAENPQTNQRWAEGMVRFSGGVTSIKFGRMGMAGSSGSHGYRRTPLENEFANTALDAIKARYGLTRFHLMGHSGGNRVVQGLMASRDDVGCVVLGAGILLFQPAQQARNNAAHPPYREYDPGEHLDEIVQHSKGKGRIFVVSDPQDIYSPMDVQVQFTNLMRARGLDINQVVVHDPGADHHDVLKDSFATMKDCVNGVPTGTILLRSNAVSKPAIESRDVVDSARRD